MKRPRILQTIKLSPWLDEALETSFDVLCLWEQADPQSFLAQEGKSIEGIATSALVGVSPDLIRSLPALKIISCRGVGLEKIDLELTRSRGIDVYGTPGVLTDCVADLAFGLVLDVARRVSAADRFIRAGKWAGAKFPLTSKVSGKRLGIVGLGQIGRVIAQRASGFSMDIRYTNRTPADDVSFTFEPSVENLAAWADFLVVSVSGGPATEHLISASVLQALGPKGFLINVSRGSVVDQDALLQALTRGAIAGAGLDVFADEPNVPEDLLALDTVVLSPHMGSGTVETRHAMESLVLENLLSFFERDGSILPSCDH